MSRKDHWRWQQLFDSERSGAKMSQLDVILFTHFHIDHSADFPALIFSSWFEERDRLLPVYGPAGKCPLL